MAATFRLAMVSDTNSIEDRNGLSPRQLRHRDVSRGLPRPPMLSLSMFHTAWIITIFHESPNAVSSATACRRVTGTPFSSYESGRAAICVRSGAQQAQETDGFGEALERDRFLALWHCLRRTPAGRVPFTVDAAVLELTERSPKHSTQTVPTSAPVRRRGANRPPRRVRPRTVADAACQPNGKDIGDHTNSRLSRSVIQKSQCRNGDPPQPEVETLTGGATWCHREIGTHGG